MKNNVRNVVWNDKSRKSAQSIYNALTRHGMFEDEKGDVRQIDLKEFHDVVTHEDILPLLPKVTTRVIAEAIEPNLLIVPNLFTQLNLPTATHIEIGAIGALTASRIPAGTEFPSQTLAYDVQGQSVEITVAKFGVGINIAQEVIDDSMFDIITLWLKAAGAALARLKESQAMKLIDAMGSTLFDNSDPTNSELGICTGRNIAGDPNGTMTLNDLFDMYVYGAQRGFVPDTLLINPLAWKTFATDSLLREVVMNGAVLASRRMPLGTFAPGWPAWQGGLGYKTTATGTETAGASQFVNSLNPLGATFNIPPNSGILPSPLKVIVTHVVPFQERDGKDPLVNIIMADSQRCGVLVQKDEPATSEADIFSREVHSIHVSERYGMNTFDQGKGIWAGRNIVAGQNFVFDNVNQATLEALPSTLSDF